MIDPPVIVLLVLLAGSVVAVCVFGRLARKRFLASFMERPELTTEQIIQLFPGCSLNRERLQSIWSVFARELGVPQGRLRPSDRLNVELTNKMGIDRTVLCDIWWDIEDLCGHRIDEAVKARCSTLYDVITATCMQDSLDTK